MANSENISAAGSVKNTISSINDVLVENVDKFLKEQCENKRFDTLRNTVAVLAQVEERIFTSTVDFSVLTSFFSELVKCSYLSK